jgi:hypothetical protein
LSLAAPERLTEREVTPDEITAIRAPAQILDRTYFDLISKYLQHCTTLRHDITRSWDVKPMLDEIDPVIAAFEQVFPT